MLVRGPCPHDNIHIRIKQLMQLLVRDPCPHDNIHQIYYNFKTGILTYFLKAFEFHLPMDYIVYCSFVCMSTNTKVEDYWTKQIVRGIIFGLELWCLTPLSTIFQ